MNRNHPIGFDQEPDQNQPSGDQASGGAAARYEEEYYRKKFAEEEKAAGRKGRKGGKKGCGCCGCLTFLVVVFLLLIAGAAYLGYQHSPIPYQKQGYAVVPSQEPKFVITEAPETPTYYLGGEIDYQVPVTDQPIIIAGGSLAVQGTFQKDVKLVAAEVFIAEGTVFESDIEIISSILLDRRLPENGESETEEQPGVDEPLIVPDEEPKDSGE